MAKHPHLSVSAQVEDWRGVVAAVEDKRADLASLNSVIGKAIPGLQQKCWASTWAACYAVRVTRCCRSSRSHWQIW
jgi:hypothetical protein